MNEVGRIRLKSGKNLIVKSSAEAFIASKITSEWSKPDDLFVIVSSFIKRDEFNNIIRDFIESGALEIEKAASFKFEINDGKDIRNYGMVQFDSAELNEAPNLPENLKKEILFLYYYGKNINYYKVLNIKEFYSDSTDKINKHCKIYRELLAGRNFEGIDLEGYEKKIIKVREIIKNACQIEEDEIRKKYDAFLMVTNPIETEKKQKEKRLLTNSDKANEHFLIAMKYFHEKEIRKAYNEILISIHLDSNNSDYSNLKNELVEILKEEKTKYLFNALENNDLLLLDETKLEQVINNVLELTDNSPVTHLKLAEIALEKEMPEMAVQHAIKAEQIDPDLKNKVIEIISKAEMKKKEFGSTAYDTNIYQITSRNIAKKG